MPSGPKISRWQNASSDSSASRSSDDAENDESDVAVFGARTGRGGEFSDARCLQKFFASLGAQEKFLVGGQAGAVREQHAKRDFAAVCETIVGEFRDDRRDRGFEIEKAALIQDHGHRGRGDDFRERSQIEDARGRDFGRIRIVGETAEGFVGDEFSAEGDRERAGGEGAGGDSLFQDAEGVAKAVVLRGEIAHQEGKTGFSIRQRQVQGYFVKLMGL
jgi:hypothetical protein